MQQERPSLEHPEVYSPDGTSMATAPNFANMIQQGEVGNVAEFFVNQDSEQEAVELDMSISVSPPAQSNSHGEQTIQNSPEPISPMPSYFHASPVERNTVNEPESAEQAL